MKIKFSVIIPVYNAEKFISGALSSVLNQNYPDIEIICLDDASTDSSLAILQQWAQRDNRIRAISHTENQGPGRLRNKAVKIARGDWLLFSDADDWFEPELFSKLDKIIKTHKKLNIIEFGFYIANNKNDRHIANYLNFGSSGIKKCSTVDIMLCTSLWNKCFKKQFFWANKLSCCENNRSGEEIPAVICAFLMAGEFYWLNFAGYNWLVNPDSLSHSRKKDAAFLSGVWQMLDCLKSEMKRLNIYDESQYNKYCATVLSWHINEKFSLGCAYRKYYNQCRKLFSETGQRKLKPYWMFVLKKIF